MNEILHRAGDIVWGPWTTLLVLLAGAWFSVRGGFPQVAGFRRWWSTTVGSVFSSSDGEKQEKEKKKISPLQSTLTALAGTLGTGNIVGVAAALAAGGPGAIFWMWIAGLLGMMTAFVENYLGVLYRRRDERGGWLGGPMLYISEGLGLRRLGGLWAALCAAAAFGMGNMAQVNAIAVSAGNAWHIPRWVTGVVMTLLAAPVVMGGMRGVTRLTSRLVPVMAGLYLLGCAAVLAVNFRAVPSALLDIVRCAFRPGAAGGGVLGAVLVGVRRGVFTNEAGLGTSVMVHSAAETTPEKQGMWGMFEVFADTLVMCTVTALVILTSGVPYAGKSDGASVSAQAFGCVLGQFSPHFISLALMLFAYATLAAWSCSGERAFGYLFGANRSWLYRLAYCAAIIPAAVMEMDAVWSLSDILNGLLAVINIVCIAALWHCHAPKQKSFNQLFLKKLRGVGRRPT
ncbi:MAG: alanine:cation symporter family protein [Ruminococcaceae bacterium]|nr:alanine:cation symporter family protein [Oscillospiraceae bacterium]